MKSSDAIRKTLKLLRDNGFVADCTECHTGKICRDYLGLFDIVAFKYNGEYHTIHLIQVTSRTNINARIKKIERSEYIESIRKLNVSILIYGWDTYEGEDRFKIVDIS
jgi:hypothetical protein